MNRNTRLGAAIAAALSNGAPKPLVAAILTIQHRGRLKRLFSIFAARFLEAFAEGRRSPASRHAAGAVSDRDVEREHDEAPARGFAPAQVIVQLQ